MEEFTFELKHGFEYAHQGESQKASAIMFKAPTAKHMKQTTQLKQQFMRASQELSQKAKSDEETETKKSDNDEDGVLMPDELLTILYISSEDIMVTILTAAELFQREEIALVDGETRFTKPIFDSMDADEFQEMMAAYMINFILASSLEKQREK